MKALPIIPRALALRDVASAIDRYRDEAGGAVAIGFVEALQRAYGHIARAPDTGSLRYAHELDLAGLRFWPLRRYPYLVFYFLQPGHVDVWRVLHGARDLPAWLAMGEAGGAEDDADAPA